MKKLLALVLALVMVLSLCITSNAAYTDAADVDFDEAVEVMTAIGVFNGTDGKFDPKGILTREQAAKIVTYMLLGKTAADALVTIAAPFADVEATRWSAGSIAYCYNEGILAGVGAGKFDPAGQLTGLAFAKMMLTALGYDAEQEGLTGANWSINAAKLALTTGLTDDMDDVSLAAPMTREQAAQMAFNTEKATMVQYDNNSTITAGNVTIKTTSDAKKVEAKRVGLSYAGYLNTANDAYVQFCEQYASNLKCTGGSDALERDSHTWSLKNNEIGEYADAADYTVVVAKQGKTYDEMIDTVSKKFDTNTVNVYVNGDGSTKTTTALVGDIMEIYMDENDAEKVDKVVVIQYSSAKLTADVKTKGTADKDLEVRLTGVYAGFKSEDNVTGWEDLKKDDVVYFYIDKEDVYNLFKAEEFTGKLTSIKSSTPRKLVVDGNDYVLNACYTGIDATAQEGLTYNTNYKYFLDNNGYVVYTVAVEDELSDYVVVQAIAKKATDGVLGDNKLEARLVKMDGTTEIVNLASVKIGSNVYTADGATYKFFDLTGGDTNTNNVNDTVDGIVNSTFFTYTIDSDGEYELVPTLASSCYQNAEADEDIKNGKANNANKAYTFDDNTVFIVAKGTSGSNVYKYNVYTGKANVPNIDDADFVTVYKNNIAKYVYVYDYDNSLTSTGDSVFFLKNWGVYTQEKLEDKTTLKYYTVDAVVNGELGTVKVDQSIYSNATKFAIGYWEPTYDANGIITDTKALTSAADIEEGTTYRMTGTSLRTAQESFVCAENVPVFFVDTDKDIHEYLAGDLTNDGNDVVFVVRTNATNPTAKYVVIYEVEDNADVAAVALPFDLNANAIKTLSDGAYIPCGNNFANDEDQAAITDQYNKYLVVKFIADDVDAKLTIKNADGTVVYEETHATGLTAGTAYRFYVDTIGASRNNADADSATQDWYDANAAAGKYTYTVTSGDYTFTGSFTVAANGVIK